jgi:hypothetical protein
MPQSIAPSQASSPALVPTNSNIDLLTSATRRRSGCSSPKRRAYRVPTSTCCNAQLSNHAAGHLDVFRVSLHYDVCRYWVTIASRHHCNSSKRGECGRDSQLVRKIRYAAAASAFDWGGVSTHRNPVSDCSGTNRDAAECGSRRRPPCTERTDYEQDCEQNDGQTYGGRRPTAVRARR